MKAGFIHVIVLLSAFVAFGGLVTDNFNRADTAYSSDGTLIGSGWNSSESANSEKPWRISSGVVECGVTNAAGVAVLYNSSMAMDDNFSLSVDIKVDDVWGGAVFNYQNPSNYYAARINVDSDTYQIIRVQDGSATALLSGADPIESFSSNQWYTFTVTGAGGNFTFEITRQGAFTVLNPSTDAKRNTQFTGGYAGYYCYGVGDNSPIAHLDNFNLRNAANSSTENWVTDSFNRSDTAFSTNLTLIGSEWTSDTENAADEWAIQSSLLESDVGSGGSTEAIIYNTATALGTNFGWSVSADVLLKGGRAGIVFNYQDDLNYYALRIGALSSGSFQFLRVLNGSVSAPINVGSTVAPFSGNRFYRICVESDGPGFFSLKVTDTVDGSLVISTNVVNSDLSGGYAGFYSANINGSPDAQFDNFSVQTGTALEPGEAIDLFSRADTAYSTNAALIGTDWAAPVPNDGQEWEIQDSQLLVDVDSANASALALLYNTSVAIDSNFVFSGTVEIKGGRSGLLFHYQNPSNYYVLRIGTADIQVIRITDGSSAVKINSSFSLSGNNPYRLTVASDSPGEFWVNVTDAKTGSLVVMTNFTDSIHAGGYAGFYDLNQNSSPDAVYDNFYLKVAAASESGYSGWAGGWGVDIGAETNDYDGDGLNNLYEYGLGGNPTNALDRGTSPVCGVGEYGGIQYFGYVHPQLSDPDSGLTYSLEICTDLVSGIWTNVGYTVYGTNVTGGSLDMVTNYVDTVDSQKFIRLIIE